MRSMILLLIAGLLVAGCLGPSEEAPATTSGTGQQPAEDGTGTTEPGTQDAEPEPEPPPVTGDGTIIEVGGSTGGVATSQQDCATMTANCGSCVAKSGCGWCKATNSCLYGDADGPDYGQCDLSDWTVTESGCNIVDSEEECAEITNCADCLSGEGCKWCIQGSICRGESTTDSCFGDWLTESYQCNYASR